LVAPTILEQRFAFAPIVVEDFGPGKGFAAFGAAGLGEAVEVIAAFTTDKLLDRDGLRPLELQRTRWTLRFRKPPQIMSAPGATDLERNECPIRRCYLAVTNKRSTSRM